MLEIIRANADDSEILSEITKKSKAYWGYCEKQMEEWSGLLTISSEYILTNNVFKLVVEGSVSGYYSYYLIENNSVRLDNFFVSPESIRKGYGSLLMNDFILKVQKIGRERVILDADPNAERFYKSLGFVKIGQIETSIKDRFLPIMEMKL
ncbi:GNAT family N-acetyltransferase [Chryseobacterium wangxinyae]|uniref:GNAT family N-acetyltransferase n=1 Tax=Chryseobacterium sp. CY350 TaxID=2997336 RepID=UPI00226FD2BA|nr:GNAT family N-acetyltransferase [Chryseobacterium sp. CY350]MCY0977368.1 GNAT family N-acetyltransferase [Chryseobacterium sp. CY350]WBZ95613.1 GNAT family N-acetyltransferase [Chryseobacterium sp. CY350]